MSSTKDKKSIFEFTDYRLYLKEYYEERKKENSKFSYRSFANRAGVSPSLFRDILSRRRNLTLAVMEKYAVAMKLKKREAAYFELLVRFNNSEDNSEKNLCFAEMIRARGRSGIRFLGEAHYMFFSQWYYSALRELITLDDFREDHDWIGRKLNPPITGKEVGDAIDFLLEIGVIDRDRKGNLIQTDAVISSEYELASTALRNFHTQMISLAGRSLEEIPRTEREVSSLTLGTSQQTLFRIKERIRIFKEELLSMVVEDTSASDTVCQLNFQLFPLTNPSCEDDHE